MRDPFDSRKFVAGHLIAALLTGAATVHLGHGCLAAGLALMAGAGWLAWRADR